MKTQSHPSTAAREIVDTAMITLCHMRALFTAVQDADDLDQAQSLAAIGLEMAVDQYDRIDDLSSIGSKEDAQ